MPKKQKKRSVKKKSFELSQYATYILLAVVFGAIIAIVTVTNSQSDPKFEITKSDVIGNNVPARDITFYGIKLGDTEKDVTKRLGNPDYDKEYDGNVKNLEYSDKLGMNDVGILFHLESGIITSITVKQSFNKYLQGDTLIDWTKDEMLQRFGAADSAETVYPFKVYTYNDRGIKFIIDRKEQNGWIFFL